MNDMKKDYSYYSIDDATSEQILLSFVKNIKFMPEDNIAARLRAIAMAIGAERPFTDVIARFNHVVSVNTCVDVMEKK